MMDFDEWFKTEHSSYIADFQIIEDHEEHVAQYKIEALLRSAFEAGEAKGWQDGFEERADQGF